MNLPILRLLLVDDEPGILKSLRTAAFRKRKDLKISEASTSNEAIQKIKTEDFDLVLLDMKMSYRTEGLDTLQKIREIKPELQVIMMSGFGEIPEAVEAMRRGALDFIPKDAAFFELIVLKVNEFQQNKHNTSSLIADRERLIRRAYEDAQTLTNIQEKGKALEDLVAALFSSVEGFLVFERNCKTATEEIDIVVENRSLDPLWQKLGALFLIECKNWHSQRVGKDEFVLFKEKIRNRSPLCKIGFLVCTEQFAETVNKEMVRHSQSEVLVVPIDRDMLRQLIEAPPTQRNRHLSDLVKKASLL
jgi:ActR/RegA family two-component response regulator